MAIAKRESLTALIFSLNPAEKRFFSTHYQRRADDKFYRLFQHLSAGGNPLDETFRKKLGVSDAGKMANLQRHLYGLVLESLRRQHRKKVVEIAVREQLDYAGLLYARGLYLDALAFLAKAKRQAKDYHLDLLHLMVVEFEKMIESRHVTRSPTERMEELMDESHRRQKINDVGIGWSNLQLALQRRFINQGHLTSPDEATQFRENYWPRFKESYPLKATFRERIGAHRAQFWYHYNLLQLEDASAAVRAWVEEYRAGSEVRRRDVNLYLKGLDRCLLLAFFRDDPEEHRFWRKKLSAALDQLTEDPLARNTQLLGKHLGLRAELNQLLLDDEQKISKSMAVGWEKEILGLEGVDRHKRQVLLFKLAVLCTRASRPNLALDFLEPILQERHPLRKELMVYARMLYLCAHYRLGNNDLVDYGINNLSRYLGRIDYPSPYPRHLLHTLRSLRRGVLAPEALKGLRKEIAALENGKHALRELRYFRLPRLLFADFVSQ